MDSTDQRESPVEITKEDFKKIGYDLIDAVSEFYDGIKDKSVTTGETPGQIQTLMQNLKPSPKT